jgi:hypothetical protein
MRILAIIASLFLMTANLTSQTGTKLVYQTRYESQDPKFHGPGRVGEHTTVTYRLADRMRTEMFRGDTPDTAFFVSIVRCDLRRTYMLDIQNHQYSESPLPTSEEIARERKQRHERALTEGEPNYIFEVKIVDTGETKQAFGHAARHYIKTTKNIPGPEFQQAPQETSEDLWYLDVPSVYCDQQAFSYGPGIHRGVGMVGTGRGTGRPVVTARPELRQTGEDPKGLLLSSRKSGQETRTTPTGEITRSTFYTITELVEFEQTPLAPAIFEVPSSFTRKETP